MLNSQVKSDNLNGGLSSKTKIRRSYTEFKENNKTKIQLTWKNITIIAPPKKSLWKRLPPDAKGYTILSNKSYLIE